MKSLKSSSIFTANNSVVLIIFVFIFIVSLLVLLITLPIERLLLLKKQPKVCLTLTI